MEIGILEISVLEYWNIGILKISVLEYWKLVSSIICFLALCLIIQQFTPINN